MPEQRAYQAEGSQFLRDCQRGILADEPGLGKTNQLIMAAEGRTLVLSPAMLGDVWAEEIATWRPDLDVHWMSYSGICKRIPAEPGKPRSMVVALPRENLPTKWDTIIADEAHYLKNRKTTWTKVVEKKLKSDRLYLATGTPVMNWGHEVYMLLKLCYPGDFRFSSYWRWLEDHFRVYKPKWGGTQVLGLHRGLTWERCAEEWGLTGRWMRREMDQVLGEVPSMSYQTIRVTMTPKQRQFYRALKKDFGATLPDTGNEVVAMSDGGLHTKLLQTATGLEVLGEGEKGSGKLQAFRDLMQDRTSATVIFCAFKRTAELLTEVLTGMGKTAATVSSAYSVGQRQLAVRRFKDGEAQCLVGTVGTLSEGITLTRADTCIFVERSPRPVTNEQARRRIRRFGQDRPTLCIDLITEDSVDEKLTELLGDKSQDIDLALTGFQLAALL